MKKAIFFIFAWMFLNLANAQTDTTLSADDLYTQARELAFNGKREEARILCEMALAKSPNYSEIAVFMGRTYAWDGNRAAAREIYKGVLEKEPYYIEAVLAMADVELWDDKPDKALEYLDPCLAKFPNNDELLVKKAKALVAAKREGEALIVLGRALEVQPGNKEAIALKNSIQSKRFKHTVYVNIAGDFYSQGFDPMYYSSIQFGTVTKPGTLIGRVNWAHRFGDNGIQPEVDFYPILWKGAYAYLNYGYTSSPLFSRHRVGAEIFQLLPKGLEASAGIRYLNFGPGSDVSIYTVSLGWYIKSYWFNARTYITPGSGSYARSLNLTARKYFADADNYIGAYAGLGFSPDVRRIQTNTGLDAGNNIYFLKSQKVGIILQKSIRFNMYVYGECYYSNQELSYGNSDYLNVVGFTTGLRIRL
jgi:YaiO family outer membrane protein